MSRIPSKLSPPGFISPPKSQNHYQTTTRTSGELHRGSSEIERGIGGSIANGASLVGGVSPDNISRSRAKRKQRKEKRRAGARAGWKKLLWVRQSYPDNYTDASTFLDHLQRNPKLQPYEFWRLVADSTVIVQQVCSVAIFVCCFTGIFQERVSPTTVVGWGSAATFVGWVVWDFWIGQEEESAKSRHVRGDSEVNNNSSPINDPRSSSDSHSPIGGMVSSQNFNTNVNSSDDFHPPPQQWQGDPLSSLSPRNQQRLATAKSATLIYCIVLGLSPILKSLTRSTTSDSIWALSTWLMGINIFFFDYGGAGSGSGDGATSAASAAGGGVGAKFPASLSTNAALMASTVLASRLASTTHVFSLTLFSIQVFGLFPVFRRHLLHVSRTAHTLLTLGLVLSAGSGLAVTVGSGTIGFAVLGSFLGLVTAALTMGGASWWLIGLQKWKDEIVGPWDAARPRLRRGWA